MPDRHSKNAAHVIISTTFVSLLAVPAVGPALSAVQIEFGIQNRDIGWMLMSSYTLPALLLVPVTGYLADRFGKKLILFPSLVIFGLCGGLVSLASNIETLICLRFIQGIGGSALVTLSTALIPDLFSGSDRIKIMGVCRGNARHRQRTFPIGWRSFSINQMVFPILDSSDCLASWNLHAVNTSEFRI